VLRTRTAHGGEPQENRRVDWHCRHGNGNGRGRQSVNPASAPVLSADESAAVRDRLMGEIADLQSQESATSWAREALAAKNRLTSADAKLL
jgi:hypothetical protein